MNKQEIKDFSEKWIKKFHDKNMNFHEIFESDDFPNECRKLQFEMDCGNKFAETYGSKMLKGEFLKANISKVDNIQILGSGIFSNWRYFNHWAYSSPTEEDITWFITALARLAELVEE